MFTKDKNRKLLDAAVLFNKTHRVNPLEQGNLFTVLDMENKEVSAHSAFLYFVFKPFQKEDDKYDYDNLRELLKELLSAKEKKYGCAHKDINEYKFLDIRREVSSNFGRLDFVINADDDIFVIELKIWAKEQHEQIERYRQYLTQQRADPNNIFFLTPSKRDAVTGDAINITLEKHIGNVMERIANNREYYAGYTSIVKQYMDVIKIITKGGNNMAEMNAIQTAEDLKAIDRLIENRNACMQTIMGDFFNKLRSFLTEIKLEGAPNAKLATFHYGEESIRNYYFKSGKYPAIAYEIEACPLKSDCKLKENVKLYFFVEVSDNLYCGITLRKMDQSDNDLKGIELENAIESYQAFQENLTSIQQTKPAEEFPIWQYLTENGERINFTIGGLNRKDSVLRLLQNDSLVLEDKKIEELITQIKNKYKMFCDAIFAK